jgi:hypothetical protein
MPTARTLLATAVVDGKIYAIGGGQSLNSPPLSTVEVYDPATDTWDTTKTDMPTNRWWLYACEVNGIIYAIGGASDTQWTLLSTVEAYDPTTDTWTTKAPMPTPRSGLANVVNGKIYVIGDLSAVEEYDPETDTWTTKKPMPTGRWGLATAVVDGIIYAMGGQSTGGNWLSTVEAYNPETDEWTTKAPMLGTGRTHFSAAAVNGIIYAVGGGTYPDVESLSLAVEAYDPVKDMWAKKADMLTPRSDLSISAVNGKIYAIGGQRGWPPTPSNVLSSNEEYTLEPSIDLGTDFKVNDNQIGVDQHNPAISVDGSGNFVITWKDQRNGDSDIYAQRYSSDGTALGANFKINDDLGNAAQGSPSISTDNSGNFVITWGDGRNEDDEHDSDIYAQRYSSDGSALSANFKVDENQGTEQAWWPHIAMDDSGTFVIVWQDGHIWTEFSDVYAQRYSTDGNVIGANFKVNDVPGTGWFYHPSISTDGSGNFVITWTEGHHRDHDIYAQRYLKDGSAEGTNFKVTDFQGSAYLSSTSVSTDGSGNFVITWGNREYGDSPVYAQRYSSDGSAIGTNFKVNENQSSGAPSISIDRSGKFVIAWQDERNGDSDIYAQRYSSDGSTFGTNFRVTNTSDGDQGDPDVALMNGRIYFSWTDNHADDTGADIWAKVLDWEDPAPVGIGDIEQLQVPSAFILSQNYPNPFNPETMIRYEVSKPDRVVLKVINLLGQEIRTLVNEDKPAGIYEVMWDGRNNHRQHVASGVYLYILETNAFVEARKMVLMR